MADTCSGTTPSRGSNNYFGGSIPWIKTGELRDNIIDNAEEHVTEQALQETSLKLLPKGTLLIAMYGQGQTRGRTGLLAREATINQACFAILPNDKFDPPFLQLWFQSSYERLRAKTEFRGGNQPNLNGDVLRQELVPLPPLAEQRRIAGRLREQLAEAAKARTAVQAQLAAAQALPAAALREVFTADAIQRWPTQAFGDLVINFDGRRIPLKQSDRANRRGPYRYYGASGVIDFVNEFLFDGDFLLIGEDGANLLSRSTPIAFKASGQFWVNNHAHVIQPKDGILLDYLEHFFAVTDLTPFVTGSAQPKLSQASMNEIPVPVPPLDLQRAVAARLASELAEATQLKTSLSEKLAAINRLPAALLSEAFER